MNVIRIYDYIFEVRDTDGRAVAVVIADNNRDKDTAEFLTNGENFAKLREAAKLVAYTETPEHRLDAIARLRSVIEEVQPEVPGPHVRV